MGADPRVSAAAERFDECVKLDGRLYFRSRVLHRLAAGSRARSRWSPDTCVLVEPAFPSLAYRRHCLIDAPAAQTKLRACLIQTYARRCSVPGDSLVSRNLWTAHSSVRWATTSRATWCTRQTSTSSSSSQLATSMVGLVLRYSNYRTPLPVTQSAS